MPRPWSRKPLSYQDALTILGAGDSRALSIADKLAGLLAAAVNIKTVGALAFFELRDEAVSWGEHLAASLRDRVTGLNRLDRTERISAAHAVIVITSFYSALDAVDEDFRNWMDKSNLTAYEQATLASDSQAVSSFQSLVGGLANSELPMPSPGLPFEAVLDTLRSLYGTLAHKLSQFCQGLAAFEYTEPIDLGQANISALADRAIAIYTETFRRLATDVPEFATWALMVDSQATRSTVSSIGADLCTRIESLSTGLAGVRDVLETTGSATSNKLRDELACHYNGILSRPILDSRRAPDDLVIPSLGSAYVNPACRIAGDAHTAQTQLAVEEWWERKPVLADIQTFLIGHLSNPVATRAPLVVLGQPGSGKSLLTRLLAAGLPPTDFLPIRVELRSVSADAAIQDQIQEALFQATDRHLDWPDLVDQAGDALPVVMLDGFDELIQATGVNQADYLERARAFQERQADLGRPVAVIVTTRTIVADRARFPRDSVAIRLEPFDEQRVERWLSVWADANRAKLATRGLRPLPAAAALAHRELAREPLLLLMLAIYDSGTNALQRTNSAFDRAELYERLMTDFARREVLKLAPSLPEYEVDRGVERELRQLGVAALAMFNRGAQIVTEAELDADLAELIPSGPAQSGTPGGVSVNRPLTAAQTVVGRFFFIHEPSAQRDTGPAERAFEFLHATFGEFLVARLVVHAVLDLAAERDYQAQRANPSPLNPGFIHAATSFELLSDRASIVEFYQGLLDMQEETRRLSCRRLLIELLRDALDTHPHWQHSLYHPVSKPTTARCAAFSANLVAMTVCAHKELVTTRELLGRGAAFRNWASLVALWRSQLGDCLSMIGIMRARFAAQSLSYESDGSGLTDIGQQIWISRETGSQVKLSECIGGGNFAMVEDGTVVGLGRLSLGEFTTSADSLSGRILREATFFVEPEQLESRLPLWRRGVSDVHAGYGFTDDAPEPAVRLLLDLAAAAPTDLTDQQRYDWYTALLEPTTELPLREAALKLLHHDLRLLPSRVARDLLLAAWTGPAMPAAFFDVLVQYALIFGAFIFLAGHADEEYSLYQGFLSAPAHDIDRIKDAFDRASVERPHFPERMTGRPSRL